jgi:tRNA(Ile)-lysidine synthase
VGTIGGVTSGRGHLRLVPTLDEGALRRRLLSRCDFPPRGTEIDCAVSGGADSFALMVLAVEAGCQVTAWHVDHGLREGADEEFAAVTEAAARYGVGARQVRIDLEPGPNLEDRARRLRFDALPAGISTGHTADDQAETILLALLRGAGLDGMTGMGAGSDGDWARHPILAIRRSETVALCAEEGLTPFEDPTNSDSTIVRNRVRHELIPLAADIAGRDVVPILARTGALLRADAEVLGSAASALDPTDAKALAAAPAGTARRAVRAWLVAATPPGSPPYPPSSAAVERVLAVARGEATACEVAGVGRIARHQQRLVIEDPAG